MSSTLYVRKTPKDERADWTFKMPFKSAVGRKFYDHDGSLGGGQITIGSEHLEWLRGVHDAGHLDDNDLKDVEEIIDHIAEGGTIDMWFEV